MERTWMSTISVDCVIFGFDQNQLKVLLAERWIKDQEGNLLDKDYTLTGYHIYQDEDLDSAAHRIVEDITGLEGLHFEQFYSFGDLNRLQKEKDQRWLKQFGDVFSERVISVAYYSLLPSTKIQILDKDRNIEWFPVYEIENLAYDHHKILDKAIKHLRYRLSHEPIAFDLLPKKFTISQMYKLYESIYNTKYDKRNFRRKVSQMKFVVPLDEYQSAVANKPAQLYMFSRDVYEATKKDHHGFFFNY